MPLHWTKIPIKIHYFYLRLLSFNIDSDQSGHYVKNLINILSKLKLLNFCDKTTVLYSSSAIKFKTVSCFENSSNHLNGCELFFNLEYSGYNLNLKKKSYLATLLRKHGV